MGKWRCFRQAIALLTVPHVPHVPHVPAIVGNAIWEMALFSQIVIPMILSVREFERTGGW